MNLRPMHTLGDCPAGVGWCSGDDHLCPDCNAIWTDLVYEFWRDYYNHARGPIGPLDHWTIGPRPTVRYRY